MESKEVQSEYIEVNLPEIPLETIKLIVDSLQMASVPLKLNYLFDGSEVWDNLTSSVEDAGADVFAVQEILRANPNIFRGFDAVNIIDVGCGNGIPALHLQQSLSDSFNIGSYIGIDISQELISKARNTLRDRYECEFIETDFEQSPVCEYIKHKPGFDSKTNANLFLFVGGTLGNFSDLQTQVRVIRNLTYTIPNSYLLMAHDIYEEKLLDFSSEVEYPELFISVFKLLGISERFYKLERTKNDQRSLFKIDAVFNKTMVLEFKSLGKKVTIRSGARINLFKHLSENDELIKRRVEMSESKLELTYKHPEEPYIYYLLSRNYELNQD